MASAAESTLLTTPRRMPFDSARPIPMMSRPPSSITSPTMAETVEVPTSRPTMYRSLRAIADLNYAYGLCACRHGDILPLSVSLYQHQHNDSVDFISPAAC